MDDKPGAEAEFEAVHRLAPEDLLSTAQLGFLKLARKDTAGATPLLDSVLRGNNEELADRVRSALKLPQALKRRSGDARARAASEARALGESSLEKGYLKDALKYLTIAHESNPLDFDVMLKLGWTLNMLHRDGEAIRWFGLARRSSDEPVAREARRAFENLRPGLAKFRTTAWFFPLYSSRWSDLFSYAQVKTEYKIAKWPVRPYLSARFVGNSRGNVAPGGQFAPQLLSESAVILGAGLATNTWRGLMAWGEAGTSAGYITGQFLPDYRGGLAYGRGWGRLLGGEHKGKFFETNDDVVFISRFGNDTLLYSQNRFGYTLEPLESFGGLQAQVLWNANITVDLKREQWANFAETGPGVRFRWNGMPPSLMFTVSALQGRHLIGTKDTFRDFRAGLWYAITR